MIVKVLYFGMIRGAIGTKEDRVELPKGSTIRDLLAKLVELHGERVREQILDEDGSLRPEAVIVLDGRNIQEMRSLDTPLEGSQEAHIVVASPAALGG